MEKEVENVIETMEWTRSANSPIEEFPGISDKSLTLFCFVHIGESAQGVWLDSHE